jgi:hypothetical protein
MLRGRNQNDQLDLFEIKMSPKCCRVMHALVVGGGERRTGAGCWLFQMTYPQAYPHKPTYPDLPETTTTSPAHLAHRMFGETATQDDEIVVRWQSVKRTEATCVLFVGLRI